MSETQRINEAEAAGFRRGIEAAANYAETLPADGRGLISAGIRVLLLRPEGAATSERVAALEEAARRCERFAVAAAGRPGSMTPEEVGIWLAAEIRDLKENP